MPRDGNPSTDPDEGSDAGDKKKRWPWFGRARPAGSRMFWAWIIYQSVKGIITLSLIWVPLLLLWLRR